MKVTLTVSRLDSGTLPSCQQRVGGGPFRL